jgi:hypothetical protein
MRRLSAGDHAVVVCPPHLAATRHHGYGGTRCCRGGDRWKALALEERFHIGPRDLEAHHAPDNAALGLGRER